MNSQAMEVLILMDAQQPGTEPGNGLPEASYSVSLYDHVFIHMYVCARACAYIYVCVRNEG